MKKTTSTLLSMALVFSSFGALSAHAESLQKEKQFSPQLKANITQWGENKIAQNVETKTSKEISVIVELQHAPLASQSNIQHAPDLQNNNAQSYHAQLKKAQEDTTKKIKEKAPKATIKETYSTLFSGFSISIPGDQITALASLPEVKAIYPNLTYKLHETSKSPANQETPNIGGPTVGAPEAWNLKDSTGKPLDGKGMKVAIIDSGVDYTHPDLKANYIGGYDTVDEDNDPMDGNVHGTHVAGIIAGNGKIKGIAPNASILAYRVMNDGGTGTTEDIIQGIEHAIQDGADVLNLSLGQDLNVPDQPVTMTLERAAKLGVTAVVSNGNDGPKPWSVDAPGNASSVISVGASTVSIPFPTFQVAGSNKSYQGLPLSKSDFQVGNDAQLVYVGYGNPSDYAKQDVKGKFALVLQGTSSTLVKAEQAKQAGALGVLLISNEKEINIMPEYFGREEVALPVMQLSNTNGEELKNLITKRKKNIKIGQPKQTELIGNFSSRGPSQGSWLIKPDVVAPGVQITSTVPRGGYESHNGTSMAAPQVAGAVALLRQMHPDWTTEQLKSSLANTAETLKDVNENTYPVMTQGSGLINIPKAVKADALVTPNNVSFGLIKPNSGKVKLTQNITLQNLSSKKKNFSTRIELLDTKTKVQTSFASSVSVKPNSNIEKPFTITVDSSLPQGVYTGNVYVKEQGKTEEIRIPFTFSIDPKEYKRIDGLEIVNSTFSPNNDQILDDNLINYYLVTPVEDVTFHANLITKDRVTYQGIVYQGKNETPGYKSFKWNGTKVGGSPLPDGLYQIEAVASNSGGETKQIGAVFVDRTAPKLTHEVDQENLIIRGKVTDILLDWMTESGWIAPGHPVTIQYEINGNGTWENAFLNHWEKNYEIYFDRSQLQQGKNTIHIVATDAAGNTSNLNVDLEVK
ncbi:S8 family serine peptidase [Bacillus toyonensis]|uniref:S8 family serine peptidase n=1 Tax=Bacillus toyonensis TaxID=155322 RepID=UPI000B44FDA1|nr:S8 family serine peptidase [Bacillus toyonensis]OTX08369.1 peptidase S8 [Bacillus thuringiensis serovar seoulensis]MCA1044753.1 S8 family serine peptidase [Bacillus toyonensis]MDO8159474.1 S8 family serine peptidase [Bacillus toyonensis]MED3199112.1 S8 family serine peptidase [Bacillus toyonensis]PHC36631.1 peptidase S8 [Bacillus toyonensis]